MSWEYRACYTLGSVDASILQATLMSFAIDCSGSSSSLVYEGNRVTEQDGPRLGWADFVADAASARPSAATRFVSEEFWFDFGFVTLPGSLGGTPGAADIRAAWLEISDGNLDRLAYALDDRGTDVLKLLVALFRALNASSMAMGMEPSAQQFVQLFAGKLPLAEMDEHISLAIAPPATMVTALRSNPRIRELDIDGMPVLARYLVGLDEYFPRSPG